MAIRVSYFEEGEEVTRRVAAVDNATLEALIVKVRTFFPPPQPEKIKFFFHDDRDPATQWYDLGGAHDYLEQRSHGITDFFAEPVAAPPPAHRVTVYNAEGTEMASFEWPAQPGLCPRVEDIRGAAAAQAQIAAQLLRVMALDGGKFVETREQDELEQLFRDAGGGVMELRAQVKKSTGATTKVLPTQPAPTTTAPPHHHAQPPMTTGVMHLDSRGNPRSTATFPASDRGVFASTTQSDTGAAGQQHSTRFPGGQSGGAPPTTGTPAYYSHPQDATSASPTAGARHHPAGPPPTAETSGVAGRGGAVMQPHVATSILGGRKPESAHTVVKPYDAIKVEGKILSDMRQFLPKMSEPAAEALWAASGRERHILQAGILQLRYFAEHERTL